MATMTHGILTHSQLMPRVNAKPNYLNRLAETVHIWRRRVRERQRLAELSEYELHDFGASSVDRFRELAKPFWRD